MCRGDLGPGWEIQLASTAKWDCRADLREAPGKSQESVLNLRTVKGSKSMRLAIVLMLLVSLAVLAPGTARAQTQVGPAELARAKSLWELSRAELSAEQWLSLGRKLADAESAYAELTTVAEASSETALVEAEYGALTGTEAAISSSRVVAGLSSAAELLPLLVLFWPATAHAPGMKHEPPAVQAARLKFEASLKDLSGAARQVQSQRAATPSPSTPSTTAATPSHGEQTTLERCLHACEGEREQREEFCRSLPNATPADKKKRKICWDAIHESVQFCKNTCFGLFGE